MKRTRIGVIGHATPTVAQALALVLLEQGVEVEVIDAATQIESYPVFDCPTAPAKPQRIEPWHRQYRRRFR